MSDDDLTTRLVAAFEKAAKGMRDGILAASDNLSYLVTEMFRTTPVSAAGSPQNAAVVAPSPKQGSDSPPRDSAIPPAPSGGTPTCFTCGEPLVRLEYFSCINPKHPK